MIGITSAPGFAPTQRAPRLSARSYGSVSEAAAFATPGICRIRESERLIEEAGSTFSGVR